MRSVFCAQNVEEVLQADGCFMSQSSIRKDLLWLEAGPHIV